MDLQEIVKLPCSLMAIFTRSRIREEEHMLLLLVVVVSQCSAKSGTDEWTDDSAATAAGAAAWQNGLSHIHLFDKISVVVKMAQFRSQQGFFPPSFHVESC